MSHFKLAEKEIQLFIRSMIAYQDRLKVDHPYSDDYPYNHEVRKEKRYLDQTIGKMENELKIKWLHQEFNMLIKKWLQLFVINHIRII